MITTFYVTNLLSTYSLSEEEMEYKNLQNHFLQSLIYLLTK